MIRRLLARLARDLLIQYRARYPLALLLGFAVWSAALRFVPDASGYVLAPAFLFLNGYLAVFSLGLRQAGGEIGDGSFAALDLTPARPHEALAARGLALLLPALLQGALTAWAGGKAVSSYATLLLALSLQGAILSLCAFAVAAALRGTGLFLARLPATVLLLVPPLLPFVGYLPGRGLSAHPLQGPLVLLQGAFFPLPARAVAVAVLSALAWIGFLLIVCRWAYGRLRMP